MDQFAEDVRGLRDYLGVERAVGGGLSMGGGVAQTLTLRHPARVRALILVSTSSTFRPFVPERFLTRAQIAEREGMAPLVDGMMAIWFTPERLRAPTPEIERIRAMTLANDPLAFAAACRANAARDWTTRCCSRSLTASRSDSPDFGRSRRRPGAGQRDQVTLSGRP